MGIPWRHGRPGKFFEDALWREVAEETSLVISLQRVACAGQSETPVRMVARLSMAGRLESGALRLSSEHDAQFWVTRAQLALFINDERTGPELSPAIRKPVKLADPPTARMSRGYKVLTTLPRCGTEVFK